MIKLLVIESRRHGLEIEPPLKPRDEPANDRHSSLEKYGGKV